MVGKFQVLDNVCSQKDGGGTGNGTQRSSKHRALFRIEPSSRFVQKQQPGLPSSACATRTRRCIPPERVRTFREAADVRSTIRNTRSICAVRFSLEILFIQHM